MRGCRSVPRKRGITAQPPRLFAALPLPAPLRREFFAASEALGRLLPASIFRRIPPDNLHLTLRFFGPENDLVERGRIAAMLRDRLEGRGPGPPVLKATGLSAFGSLRRARVVWVAFQQVGISENEPPPLLTLQQQVESVAREIGIAPESRPFVPHVTIGRLRAPARLSAEDLSAVRRSATDAAWGAPFTVREFCLFASRLLPGGAVYECLDRFSLDG